MQLTLTVQKCALMRFMNCMIDITRCPLTLILTKTQIILSNMKSYENDKKSMSNMNYPKSGLGAFLDISPLIKIVFSCTLTKKYNVVSQNKHFRTLVIMYAVMCN